MSTLDYVYARSDSGAPLRYGTSDVIWATRRSAEVVSSAHDQQDYAQMLVALLPMGAAWPSDPASNLQQLLAAMAAELGRLDARSAHLATEAMPSSATELLGDWERVAGLPDPCVAAVQTLAERRRALEGRITSVGGQSRAFFIQLANRLGYSITIEEFRSSTEATLAGIPFTGDGWAHTWRVNVGVSVAVSEFRVGTGSVGEPLRSWGNEVLECQFRRHKPAHTTVLFSYAS